MGQAPSTSPTRFDVEVGDLGAKPDGHVGGSCTVVDGMDAVGACESRAPPDSWDPRIEWTFYGQGIRTQSSVTALVANLTDDDGNEAIDLCDTPDVVVVVGVEGIRTINVRDFCTRWTAPVDRSIGRAEMSTQYAATPAIGDIDGDGIVEIVAVEPGDGCPDHGLRA